LFINKPTLFLITGVGLSDDYSLKKKINIMTQMIANPAVVDASLRDTTLMIAFGAGCVFYLSLQVIPRILEAVSNSSVTTAEIVQVDVPDIFDEDLDPEVIAGLNAAYADDD
jgi:hypothetical protein